MKVSIHQRRLWRRSLLLSAMIHSLPSLILIVLLPAAVRSKPRVSDAIQTYVAESTFNSHWTVRPDITLAELTEAAEENRPASPEIPRNTAILPDFIQLRLQQEMDTADQSSPEDLRTRLERLGGQLQSESSEKSVNAIAKFLGTQNEMPPSGTEPAGEFDHTTAQIDHVDKSVADDGSVTYIATLVDSQGHEQQVAMSDEDGAQLYETFELMKRFPLLENIYRQVVMGMLNKMLAEPEDAGLPKGNSSVPSVGNGESGAN